MDYQLKSYILTVTESLQQNILANLSPEDTQNEEIKQRVLIQIRDHIEKCSYSPTKYLQNIISSIIEIYQGDINELLFNYKKKTNLFTDNDDDIQT